MSMENPRIVGISRKTVPASWQETLFVAASRSSDIHHVRDTETWRAHLFSRAELDRIQTGVFESEQQAIDLVDEAVADVPGADKPVHPYGLEVNRNKYLIVRLYSAETIIGQRNAVAEKIIEFAGIDIRIPTTDGIEWEAGMVIGRSFGTDSESAIRGHLLESLPTSVQLQSVRTKVLPEAEA